MKPHCVPFFIIRRIAAVADAKVKIKEKEPDMPST